MDANDGNLYFCVMRSAASHRGRAREAPAIPAFFLYGDPPRPPEEGTVHIETIAARSALHDWTIAAHRHRDLHQLLVIDRGRIDLRLDDHRDVLKGPAILVVPPGTVHAFAFQENTAGLVVSFAGGLARALGSAGTGPGPEPLERPAAMALSRAEFDGADIAQIGSLLLREFGRSALGRDAAMRGLLGALLANVLRVLRPEPHDPGASVRDRELVAQFRQSIDRRHRHGATVADYAREFEVSLPRLRRACLAAAGQTPMALLHQRRLVEAERQLRYTTMTVAQVAYYLGFEDPAYFTRFFTRGTGKSPRVFRRRLHFT